MIDSGREIDGQMLTDLEAFGRLAAISLENGRLFEDTERLRRRAEEANLAKDNFIATVSHELRTPLTSVLGWAKILRTDRLDADMLKRGLEVIERNAMAQAQLIEDLLDVSRIVAGKLEIEPKPIFVSTLVESALESARPAASAKGIRLGAVIDPEIGSIEADPRRLQQVIWNLVTNAVKFTPREGVIRVTARRADGAVEICVSDSGAGIEAAFLPKVFERFQQAHEGNRAGGLGLGLAIVRHIVEQHGGHVFAESDGRGKGARFVVRLPAPGRPALRDEDRRSPVPAQAAPRALEGARVLVVDDEDDARDLVVTVLQGAGAIATDARSVDEALTAFRAGEVDAVVSDIGMPERDGYALIKELRALERPLARRMPVIALTAFARGEDRTRALVAGFTTHVPKPLEPEELIMVLASALGREVGVPRSK
jgi:CheY-like chemotaxis protein/nitrogen-specific signal transduction histidine kinase